MESKICPNCGPKPVSEFAFKNKAAGVRHSICKLCHSTYHAQHYLNNRAKYIAQAKRNVLIQRELNFKLQEQYLREHPCARCPESDPVVLEFHHRDRTRKRFGISNGLKNGYSWKTILTEIAKCEVLCCNCHRRQTAKDLGWRLKTL